MIRQQKIISYVIWLSAAFIVVLATSLAWTFIIPAKALEAEVAQRNFQFSLDALQSEMNHLSRFVFDWSSWDATAQFIQDNDRHYLEENLQNITFFEQNINVFCVLNTEGHATHTKCVKFHNDEARSIELAMFTDEALQKNRILWNHKDPDSSITGYCATEGGVLMLCSRPVTGNAGEGPIRGTLIIGRFVSDSYLTAITKQVCFGFQWWNLQDEYTHAAMDHYISQITGKKPIFLEFTENMVSAYAILPDITGKDAILIKSILPNSIIIYRKEFMAKSAIIFLVESLLFLLTLGIGIANRIRLNYGPTTQDTAPASAIDTFFPATEYQKQDTEDKIPTASSSH